MSREPIKRIAFLQEYHNRPETLKALMPEIAAHGYHAIVGAIMTLEKIPVFAELAAAAEAHGLEAMAFGAYMKYQYAYLNEHPDQRMVFAMETPGMDQDQLPTFWGCPFNKTFEARHDTYLRALAQIPNLTEVWINDEAFLGSSAEHLGCYCPICQADWAARFGGAIPRPPFADVAEKQRFAQWRFDRWNAAHAHMKDVLNEDHAIRAVFQASPHNCFHQNPWISGVYLPEMVKHIDGIMTDPYYTFHLAYGTFDMFQPLEIYQSECCRYLRGAAGPNRLAELCAQGFSHPSFVRPQEAKDGWWSSVVPTALGLRGITSYTYLLQGAHSDVKAAYEASFALDQYFNDTEPLAFAAILDSVATRCCDDPAENFATSWAATRLLTLGKAMRHNGLPYLYVPSDAVLNNSIDETPVVILPEVSCLSADERTALKRYVRNGGVVVACGQTACHDETGQPLHDDFLTDLFGIAIEKADKHAQSSRFQAICDSPAFADLPWPDAVTAAYMDGAQAPALSLSWTTDITVTTGDATVLGCFDDTDKPAFVQRSCGKGLAVYLAGIPTRTFTRPGFASAAINFTPLALAKLLISLRPAALPLRVKNFPPEVPMKTVRPLDARWRPTMEFLPSIGPNSMIATIPSYFRESGTFQVIADIPQGRTCRAIRELVSDTSVTPAATDGQCITLDVTFTIDDFLKVFLFELD